MGLGVKECILLDNVVFLSIHVMKVAGISPFKVACTSGPFFEKNHEAVPHIFSSNN